MCILGSDATLIKHSGDCATTQQHSAPEWVRHPLDAALQFAKLGLSIIPIRRDGTKGPETPSWKQFQTTPADEGVIRPWFRRTLPPGIAILGGKVSCNLAVIDFEDVELFEQWADVVRTLRGDGWGNLVIVETPRPGRHVYCLLDHDPPGSEKLAKRPATSEELSRNPDDEFKTLIETKAEGGYVVAPGSPGDCHETGREYRFLQSGWMNGKPKTAIKRDTFAKMLNVARDFDQRPPVSPMPTKERRNTKATRPSGEISPIEDWNKRGPTIRQQIEEVGWRLLDDDDARGPLIRRPGKEIGHSGRIQMDSSRERMYVFSTSTDFEATECGRPRGYDSFEVYAVLNHGKDDSKAAKAIYADGYGFRASSPRSGIDHHYVASVSVETAMQAPSVVPPKSNAQDFAPFPVHLLPEPLATFVARKSKAIGCDPAYIAVAVLAVVASLIGNTRRIRLKNSWFEPSVIWAMLVGESGSHKSPALAAAVDALQAIQRRLMKEFREKLAQYLEDLKAWKAKPENEQGSQPVRPVPHRILVSDITIEKVAEILNENLRGVLLNRDEIAGWIGSFTRYKSKGSSSDLQHWLEAHGARNWTVDRKTNPEPIFVPHAAVSVVGGIQPAILRSQLTEEFRCSGFAARLLMVWPDRRPKTGLTMTSMRLQRTPTPVCWKS